MCEEVELEVKKVVEVEQCYPVTRTVCTETVETVPNEVDIYIFILSINHIYNISTIYLQVCVYTYAPRDIETEAVTVSVEFASPCVTQIVTVCDPGASQIELQTKVLNHG